MYIIDNTHVKAKLCDPGTDAVTVTDRLMFVYMKNVRLFVVILISLDMTSAL